MKKLCCCLLAATLMAVLGCGGGDSESEGDDSSSSNSSSSTQQQTADAGDTTPETNSDESTEGETDTSSGGSGTSSDEDESASTETNNGDVGDTANTDSTDQADSETPSTEETDPIKDLALSLGNPQLSAAYTQIRSAAAAPTAGPQELYTEINLLQTIGAMLLQEQRMEECLLAFRASYDSALAAEEKLGSHPDEAKELLANVYYNGACVLSLSEEIDEAHGALARSIELGFSDTELLKTDGDLDNLRKREGFDADLAGWLETIESASQFAFDFEVTDLEGNALSLASLHGKVVIVDFWGTWCPPCREEIPSFIKLQEKFGDEGLQIIGLNYERVPDAEAPQVIKDFIAENGINYPCAIGTPAIRGQVPDFEGYPTTLFIDRNGVVRNMTVGLHPYESLEEQVVSLLAESVDTDESADETADESSESEDDSETTDE